MQDLLESVLRETLAAVEDDSSTASELAALKELAQRRRDERFDVEPIGVEMVEAVLAADFSALVPSREAWSQMTRAIAHTLCDDPISRQRLEDIWHRLTERAA